MNALLSSLLPHLAALLTTGESVDLSLSISGALLRLTVLPVGTAAIDAGHEEDGAGTSPEGALPPLTPTMKLIVATLDKADRPLKGEAVARRAGKNYTGHFRTVLRQLKDRKIVLLLDEGYWLAENASQEEREGKS